MGRPGNPGLDGTPGRPGTPGLNGEKGFSTKGTYPMALNISFPLRIIIIIIITNIWNYFKFKGDTGRPGEPGDKGERGSRGRDGPRGDACESPAASIIAGYKGLHRKYTNNLEKHKSNSFEKPTTYEFYAF